MEFDYRRTVELLGRTPDVLTAWLGGLSDKWTGEPITLSPDIGSEPAKRNGGVREEWEPYDVLGHLIHGERTDWIPRAKIILESGTDRAFETFDRFAQFDESHGKTLGDLLDEFRALRQANLAELDALELTPEKLSRSGIHPELGEVTLAELLATWAVHDLTHIRQIANVMAKRYVREVGPWREYLSILK